MPHELEALLESLLEAASYKDGEGIVGVLAKCGFCIGPTTQLMAEAVRKRKKWRVLLSGLMVMRIRTRKYAQATEFTKEYLRALNGALRSGVKRVRTEAVQTLVECVLMLHREALGDREYVRADIRRVGRFIQFRNFLKAAGGSTGIAKLVSSSYLTWVTGFRYERLPEITMDALSKIWPEEVRKAPKATVS